jgi:hypothetical protein
MGISADCAKFLFFSKQKGVSFNKSLMLGRQSFPVTKNELNKIVGHFKNEAKNIDNIAFTDGYAEPLFKLLGAETIDSIDF